MAAVAASTAGVVIASATAFGLAGCKMAKNGPLPRLALYGLFDQFLLFRRCH